jgi:hypothetical protein
VEFPPIDVFFDGQDYWLADGFHRVGAALRVRPDQPIEAEVHQGTQSDAQWYSFGVNQTHGLRRTREDRTRAIREALRHPLGLKKSDRDIAHHIGVDHKTVAKYRTAMEIRSVGETPQLKTRIGRDGKNYRATKPANTSSNGKRPKTRNGASPKAFKPTIAPSLMEKMTAINVPHNPVAAARALVEVFGAEYVRELINALTQYLEGVDS